MDENPITPINQSTGNGKNPVYLPQLKAFDGPDVQTGKDVLVKGLEEMAELVEAGKDWMKAGPDDIDKKREHLLYEFGDVLQTMANIAHEMGMSDTEINWGYQQTVAKNTERGRFTEEW